MERIQADVRLNDRVPHLLTVSFTSQEPGPAQPKQGARSAPADGKPVRRFPPSKSLSRSCPLHLTVEDLEEGPRQPLAEPALAMVKKWQAQREVSSPTPSPLCLTTMFLTVGNFQSRTQKSRISDFMKAKAHSPAPKTPEPPPSPGAGVAPGPEREAPATPTAAPPAQSSAVATPADEPADRPKLGATSGRAQGSGDGAVVFSVDASEVDESVLAELPPDIRAELMQQLGNHRSSKTKATPHKKGTLQQFFGKRPAQGGQVERGEGTARPAVKKAKPVPGTLDAFFKSDVGDL
jgi:hypothetical protein